MNKVAVVVLGVEIAKAAVGEGTAEEGRRGGVGAAEVEQQVWEAGGGVETQRTVIWLRSLFSHSKHQKINMLTEEGNIPSSQ